MSSIFIHLLNCYSPSMSLPLPKPLSEAEPGPVLLVDHLDASEKICRRLREVGFCEKAEIQLLSRGGQIICNVCGTRLALSRALAKKIWVRQERVHSHFS